MAEVQTSNQSGEMAARFIEFVQMQSQNAALFLGLIPTPGGGQPEVNLELARLFIDQLAMIGEKTRGNLSPDETKVLRNALTNLQMAFFEVSQGQGQGGGEAAPLETPASVAPSAPEASAKPAEMATSVTPTPAPSSEEPPQESKKRFTKSYGS